MWVVSRSTGVPAASLNSVAPGRSTTISSSFRYWTVRVSDRKAGIAEPMNDSFSPTPTTSGHSLRAPTSTSGSSALIATKA